MENNERNSKSLIHEEEVDVRKGPWSEEEDKLLSNYVSIHGDRRWNRVARCSGLKRTGKSCRLRWLNYLRPSVRHGNLTLEEQYLILKLHCVWGNRWSKIVQQLPGRTDNEVKNYFRTRVRKQARQLNCDVNSNFFKETVRHVLMPRLLEQIQVKSSSASSMFQPTENYDLKELHMSACMAQHTSIVSGTSLNSPNDLSTGVSIVSNPVDCYSQTDNSVTGLGLYPDNSGFENFNDWDNLWNEDDFGFLLGQLSDGISYK